MQSAALAVAATLQRLEHALVERQLLAQFLYSISPLVELCKLAVLPARLAASTDTRAFIDDAAVPLPPTGVACHRRVLLALLVAGAAAVDGGRYAVFPPPRAVAAVGRPVVALSLVHRGRRAHARLRLHVVLLSAMAGPSSPVDVRYH